MPINETTPGKQPPPFPVVLDRSEDNAYAVITWALSEYAERARHEALNEATMERPDQYQIDDLNKYADIADRLNADVERQLDEAGKASS